MTLYLHRHSQLMVGPLPVETRKACHLAGKLCHGLSSPQTISRASFAMACQVLKPSRGQALPWLVKSSNHLAGKLCHGLSSPQTISRASFAMACQVLKPSRGQALPWLVKSSNHLAGKLCHGLSSPQTFSVILALLCIKLEDWRGHADLT